jgi:starch synthase
MRILIASSEAYPYSKTGGLADMVSALAKAMARAGHLTGLVSPLYSGIRERYPDLVKVGMPLELTLGTETVSGEVWCREPEPKLRHYFVEQPGFFQRATLYQQFGMDFPDNAERFIFFSKAVAYLGQHLDWRPDIVHLNDWQTGLTALFLEHQRRAGGMARTPKTCFTIHNLAYQGLFPPAKYPLTNLPWDYFTAEGVEFYGQLSALKAGLAYSEQLTTVSPRYAREITTEEYGCGMDGLLRYRQKFLSGILNGVDYDEWNTLQNRFLAHPYSVEDLTGKAAEKRALQEKLGLQVDASIPLFGNVGRLVEQKGTDILLPALEQALAGRMQFVLVGTGAPTFEAAFSALAHRHPGKVAVKIGYDEALSHQVEAGCDFFVMPSRFEPCGLNQMYSLRYGTVPLVRAVGGLDDTVVDIKEDAQAASGIKFHQYAPAALAKAFQKAVVLFGEKDLLHHFRCNGMATDFSWKRTMGDYLKVYEQAKV